MGDKSPKNREKKKPKADKKVSGVVVSSIKPDNKPK